MRLARDRGVGQQPAREGALQGEGEVGCEASEERQCQEERWRHKGGEGTAAESGEMHHQKL